MRCSVRHLVVFVGLLSGLITLAVLAFRTREPQYWGKPLSFWIDRSNASQEEARLAVQTVGTNGVPTLLRWLTSVDSPLHRYAQTVLARCSWGRIRLESEDQKRQRAVVGFIYLGTNGVVALPDVVACLSDRNAGVRHRAANIIKNMSHCCSSVGAPMEPFEAALPLLVKGLDDPWDFIRHNHIMSIGQITLRPELSVAALIGYIERQPKSEPDETGIEYAVHALGRFGPRASAALPLLERLREDNSAPVREATGKAVEMIAPGQRPG
jgi:HEAT repeat protein